MFHYIRGKLVIHDKKYLINEMVGIEVYYEGTQTDGEYWLYTILDTNSKQVFYYAFDEPSQKSNFTSLLQIPGVGAKTAYQLSLLDKSSVKDAVENLDVRFFESLPGIGPKLAKRIIMELKSSLDKEQIQKIDINDKLLKDIISGLKTLGYESSKIKAVLEKCDIPFQKENTQQIIKRVLDHI